MALLCIFRDNKLIEIHPSLRPDQAQMLKESTAQRLEFEIEELDCAIFDDSEIELIHRQTKNKPKKTVKITKEKAYILGMEEQEQLSPVTLNWLNCSNEQLEAYYTEEQIQKINENKTYLDSLGPEKYKVGFKPDFPNDIINPTIEIMSAVRVETVIKEVNSTIV